MPTDKSGHEYFEVESTRVTAVPTTRDGGAPVCGSKRTSARGRACSKAQNFQSEAERPHTNVFERLCEP